MVCIQPKEYVLRWIVQIVPLIHIIQLVQIRKLQDLQGAPSALWLTLDPGGGGCFKPQKGKTKNTHSRRFVSQLYARA